MPTLMNGSPTLYRQINDRIAGEGSVAFSHSETENCVPRGEGRKECGVEGGTEHTFVSEAVN